MRRICSSICSAVYLPPLFRARSLASSRSLGCSWRLWVSIPKAAAAPAVFPASAPSVVLATMPRACFTGAGRSASLMRWPISGIRVVLVRAPAAPETPPPNAPSSR